MSSSWSRGVEAAAIVAVVMGCTGGGMGDDEPSSNGEACEERPETQRTACWTARYFGGARPAPLAACAGAPAPTPLDGRREVSFFMGPKVSEDEVREQGALLQGFFDRYRLAFFTHGPSQNAGFNYAMSGSEDEFEAVIEEVGVAPDKTPTAAQKAQIEKRVQDIMFKNLRTFTKAQSDTSTARVNVVVLEAIASPYVRSLLDGGVIVGLGLSPTLLRSIAQTDPSSDLFKKLGLPQDFTPILFLGSGDIKRLAKNPGGTVAHEMGHALGLQHTTEPGNVMTQGQSAEACEAALTREQVEAVAAAAERIADPMLLEEGYKTIVLARDAIVSAAITNHAHRAR